MTPGYESDVRDVPRQTEVQRVVRKSWQRTTAITVAGIVLLLFVHGTLAARVGDTGALRGLFALTTIGILSVVGVGLFALRPLVMPGHADRANPVNLVEDLESMNKRVRELERSNEELSEFAHVASHDLKEPLRMVQSYLELLDRKLDEELDEQTREYLERAVDGAKRMDELIEGLLTYAHAGEGSVAFEPVALEGVLDDAVDNLAVRVDEADATIDVGDLPTIQGDPVGLRQVFQNLIGNAIKFRREGVNPRIDIRAERENGIWRIDVSDNGQGFDPAEADDLFKIFQRGSTSKTQEGTGIGLSVVDRIVARHGGSVEATSTPGEGSTFTIRLPASEEERLKSLEERSKELV